MPRIKIIALVSALLLATGLFLPGLAPTSRLPGRFVIMN